ncbi:hypothetical protein B0T21DRAFT_426057 [Apiosordaria backusii]|uniref:Uncharacterized protein n=1 Tax=Apiosordaria backusii TaxID=314023 RepID=A0AA40DV32_9PEZI|nr:hypothetical protein B0T21DRAFT_426057 [Apiosordaria backusii]
MSQNTATTSQTLDNSDSEIEVMADFKTAPDGPFWEIPGFLFDDSIVADIEKHSKQKIWKALISPDYTRMPQGSSQNSNPEAVIKNRVRNNVALLFRGLNFFKDFHSAPKYYEQLSPDTLSRSGKGTIEALERIYFLDSAPGNMIPASLKKPELRDKWAALKKRGALFNLAQHSPDDVEDDSSDDSDDEVLTLPGERRNNTTTKKRKQSTSAPRTPSRPSKRPSTSSARRSARTVRVVSPPSSPPVPRFDSAIGLTSDSTHISEDESMMSSSIYSPETPSMLDSRSAHRKITERLRVIDLEMSQQAATLIRHTNSIESLKIDISLQNGTQVPTQLNSTVKSAVARIEKLEEKKKSNEGYITHVVKDQLKAIKTRYDEKLGAFDSKLDSKLEACVRNLAVEESKRKDIKTSLAKLNMRHEKLQDAVKRHRGHHKKLAQNVVTRLGKLEKDRRDAGSDGSTDSEEEDEHQRSPNSDKSCIAKLQTELATLRQANEKQNARLVLLETTPSTGAVRQQGDDLKDRVTAQEEEISRLKEGNSQLKEEMAQLKHKLNKSVNEIPGLVKARVLDEMKLFEEGLRQNHAEHQPPFTPQGLQQPQNPELRSPLPNRPSITPRRHNRYNNDARFNRGHGGGNQHHRSPHSSQQSMTYPIQTYHGDQGKR